LALHQPSSDKQTRCHATVEFAVFLTTSYFSLHGLEMKEAGSSETLLEHLNIVPSFTLREIFDYRDYKWMFACNSAAHKQ
jgi:hypothetical protein